MDHKVRGHKNILLADCKLTERNTAPTALGNGPTIIETQIDIIADMLKQLGEQGVEAIEPDTAAEKGWTEDIQAVAQMTLMPLANSWYMGANIPGKKREMLNYLKGLEEYERSCRGTLETWEGFKTVKAEA